MIKLLIHWILWGPFLLKCSVLSAQVTALHEQEQPHRLELGFTALHFTLAPVTLSYFTPTQQAVTLGPGAFFRYQRGNVSFRSHVVWIPEGGMSGQRRICFDCTTWEQDVNRIFFLSAGSQLNLNLRRSCFYIFGDLYMRFSHFEGTYFNPWGRDLVDYEVSSKGIGMRPGSGLRMRLFWKLHFTTEIFGDILKSFELMEETNTASGETINLTSRNFILSGGLRFFLSITF